MRRALCGRCPANTGDFDFFRGRGITDVYGTDGRAVQSNPEGRSGVIELGVVHLGGNNVFDRLAIEALPSGKRVARSGTWIGILSNDTIDGTKVIGLGHPTKGHAGCRHTTMGNSSFQATGMGITGGLNITTTGIMTVIGTFANTIANTIIGTGSAISLISRLKDVGAFDLRRRMRSKFPLPLPCPDRFSENLCGERNP